MRGENTALLLVVERAELQLVVEFLPSPTSGIQHNIEHGRLPLESFDNIFYRVHSTAIP